jgi:branched-chain amino acid transport system permease protein
VLELVRSFSNLYFPNTWQLALGLFLLGTILFLPQGIGSLWARRRRPNVLDATGASGAAAPVRGAAE